MICSAPGARQEQRFMEVDLGAGVHAGPAGHAAAGAVVERRPKHQPVVEVDDAVAVPVGDAEVLDDGDRHPLRPVVDHRPDGTVGGEERAVDARCAELIWPGGPSAMARWSPLKVGGPGRLGGRGAAHGRHGWNPGGSDPKRGDAASGWRSRAASGIASGFACPAVDHPTALTDEIIAVTTSSHRFSVLGLVALVGAIVSTSVSHAPAAAPPGEPDAVALDIGDPAPPIAASAWLRGEPVTAFEPGHVHVLEFWASWCAPCIAGMPHLSALQTRFAGDVTIIGMNIWEEPAKASAWVAEQDDALMQYTVAIQAGTEMETRWMDAAGQDGIPTAFIVDGAGVIAWIGHPAGLDEPLARIVDGTWDVAAFRAEFRSEAESQRRERAAMARFEEMAADQIAAYMAATEALDLDAIADTATALMQLRPPAAISRNLIGVGLHRMLTGRRAMLAVDFLWRNRRVLDDDPDMLVQYGRAIIHDDLFAEARDARLAVSLLERACELTEYRDGAVLDLLARAYVLRATQVQAMAVRYSDAAGTTATDRRRRLEAYEEAMPDAG
jgi:thiol-disulfide isomerase/thioredoxin